jgi:signal transduction histidine kinase
MTAAKVLKVVNIDDTHATKYGDVKEAIRVQVDRNHEKVLISVNNRGKPLSPVEQAYLFDPYRRTSSAENSGEKGWGLGLTLVKGFSESYGGNVSVKSSASEGTTFLGELPLDSRPKSAD